MPVTLAKNCRPWPQENVKNKGGTTDSQMWKKVAVLINNVDLFSTQSAKTGFFILHLIIYEKAA